MANIHTYSCQDISDDDINAVVSVLKSSHLTQGPATENFERDISTFTGSQFAVAFNSATSALHATLHCLGVRKGSTVWTTANTFAATANAALYCGATIDFIDIDPASLNISIEVLERKLKASKSEDCLPDVVIAVHFAGNPINLKDLRKLSKDYNFLIVEDASHAFGSRYHESRIGDCQFSDACVFSFHAVKPVTAGEGGAATTNSALLKEQLKLFRSHGITKDSDFFTEKSSITSQHPWYYEQISLGYNYRMSDIHAALGSSQITRAQSFCDKRNHLARLYSEHLGGEKLKFQHITLESVSAYHLMVVQFESEAVRDRVNRHLTRNAIGTNLHYIPVYRHPYYRSAMHVDTFLDNTEHYYRTALSIPLHTKLSESDVAFVAKLIKESRANE